AAVVAGLESAGAAKRRMWFLERHAPREVMEARGALAALEAERAKYLETVPTVMVMKEREDRRETFLLKRGAYDAPGEPVGPATPSALPPMEGPPDRLGLARWLVSKENPLTARVAVNRLWQMLFGVGLVKTVEDFGSQGEWPLHEEMLDWLAVEFMESGWDVKRMLKTMVMSATYRQASSAAPELWQRDPENRLLARGPRVRLPAEMLRDQALAVSGLLVEKTGGPSVRPYQPAGLWQELHGGKGYEADKGEGLYRRSLYTYWKRTVAPPNMVNFDSPTRETCVVRESRTDTPLQALNLMNDVVYVEASRKLAERMMREGGASDGGRIGYAMLAVLAREAKPEERELFGGALAKFRKYYAAHPEEADKLLRQGESGRAPEFDAGELAATAALASLVLNLDEAVTKQ
ncbi:MAG: DUF1553 domain-containing protein, partial [Acidobacteria bacterium]|nr:DUF1553 domain-containing protein [Acidobacteriota bacterium]